MRLVRSDLTVGLCCYPLKLAMCYTRIKVVYIYRGTCSEITALLVSLQAPRLFALCGWLYIVTVLMSSVGFRFVSGECLDFRTAQIRRAIWVSDYQLHAKL
jgi:hypothetical protein